MLWSDYESAVKVMSSVRYLSFLEENLRERHYSLERATVNRSQL
jgi:hypothetical protein